MYFKRYYIGACLFLLFNSFFSFSQDNSQTLRPSFLATQLDKDPKVDGNILTDEIWQAIDPIKTMKQIRPNFGASASEKTEIRVAYSNSTFYVAVVCYDSDPNAIVVSDSRRDADLSD